MLRDRYVASSRADVASLPGYWSLAGVPYGCEAFAHRFLDSYGAGQPPTDLLALSKHQVEDGGLPLGRRRRPILVGVFFESGRFSANISA